jgi:hypothetical protein
MILPNLFYELEFQIYNQFYQSVIGISDYLHEKINIIITDLHSVQTKNQAMIFDPRSAKFWVESEVWSVCQCGLHAVYFYDCFRNKVIKSCPFSPRPAHQFPRIYQGVIFSHKTEEDSHQEIQDPWP